MQNWLCIDLNMIQFDRVPETWIDINHFGIFPTFSGKKRGKEKKNFFLKERNSNERMKVNWKDDWYVFGSLKTDCPIANYWNTIFGSRRLCPLVKSVTAPFEGRKIFVLNFLWRFKIMSIAFSRPRSLFVRVKNLEIFDKYFIKKFFIILQNRAKIH